MEAATVDGIFTDLTKYASLLRAIASAVRSKDKRALFDALLSAARLFGFVAEADKADEIWTDFEKKDWPELVSDIADLVKMIAASQKANDVGPIRMMAVVDDTAAALDACAALPMQAGEEPKPVENPLVIIALIGLAINIARFIRERRQNK